MPKKKKKKKAPGIQRKLVHTLEAYFKAYQNGSWNLQCFWTKGTLNIAMNTHIAEKQQQSAINDVNQQVFPGFYKSGKKGVTKQKLGAL